MRVEFKVNLKQNRTAHARRYMKRFKAEPQLRQSLILAYQIKDVLEKNPQRNLREISEWLGFTRGRISQILNLLFLSPKIQEDIILSERKILFSIPEYKLRPIMKKLSWKKQLRMWLTYIK